MSATSRHCPRCGTDVEDVGGFCLLGHRLNESAHPGSLSDLRAEVDRAFEEAKVQVSEVLQGAAPPAPPLPAHSLPSTGASPVIAPPPPTLVGRGTAPLVIDTEPIAGDPIVDFAPAPRMDWGPERQGLRKRLG